MGETSAIAWTDATFNPWWGCARVSPGCERCYAETFATVRRKLPVWGVDAQRKAMSLAYWHEPVKWNRKAAREGRRRRVFCASFGDVFEIVPDRNTIAHGVMSSGRARLWPLIESTPWLDWLLLTKRPENVARLAPWSSWPANVWLGVTVEDNPRRGRLNALREIPAAIRFVSYEPALERVNWAGWLEGIDWMIIGGESGPGARPFDLDWARGALEACTEQRVAPFMKQLGANPHDSSRSLVGGWCPGDPEPDTRVQLIDRRKGGDPTEWPIELRVRAWPRGHELQP